MKLLWFRDRKPESHTVQFPAVRWDRLRYEYAEIIREGVRAAIRLLHDGATRDAFASLALTLSGMHAKDSGDWPMFSFSPAIGMWRGMILPEIEEQLESARISGPASLRNTRPIGESTPSRLVGRRGEGSSSHPNGRSRQGRPIDSRQYANLPWGIPNRQKT